MKGMTDMRNNIHRRSKHSKRGFTLVELVVVIAILSLCSGMLVGIIASTLDRFCASSDMETRRQEAVKFEQQYTQCARAAFSIYPETSYNPATFVPQKDFYYMEINPTTKEAVFFCDDDTGHRMDIARSKYIKSFSHNTETTDKAGVKTALKYRLVMDNEYDDVNDYVYDGSTILDNGNGVTISGSYDLESETNVICIAFRTKP